MKTKTIEMQLNLSNKVCKDFIKGLFNGSTYSAIEFSNGDRLTRDEAAKKLNLSFPPMSVMKEMEKQNGSKGGDTYLQKMLRGDVPFRDATFNNDGSLFSFDD